MVTAGLAAFVRSQVNAHRGEDPHLAALTITPYLGTAVLIAGAVFALVLLRSWRPRAAVAAFVVVPIAVAVQGVIAAAPVWEQVAADRFYPTTDMHEFLRENLGHDRMATTGLTMLNGTPAYYGLRSATGHVFFPAAYSDVINRVSPEAAHADVLDAARRPRRRPVALTGPGPPRGPLSRGQLGDGAPRHRGAGHRRTVGRSGWARPPSRSSCPPDRCAASTCS